MKNLVYWFLIRGKEVRIYLLGLGVRQVWEQNDHKGKLCKGGLYGKDKNS